MAGERRNSAERKKSDVRGPSAGAAAVEVTEKQRGRDVVEVVFCLGGGGWVYVASG